MFAAQRKRREGHQRFLESIDKISKSLKQEQSPQKILIIEEEKSLTKLLSAILFDEGYIVNIASSLTEVEREVVETGCSNYNVILLDVNLSNGDGIDWLEEVRGKGCQIPVIMLTNYPSYERQEKAYKLGVRSFVEKPVRMDRLLSRLREVLRYG